MKCAFVQFTDYQVQCESYVIMSFISSESHPYVIVRNKYFINYAGDVQVVMVIFALAPNDDASESYFLASPSVNVDSSNRFEHYKVTDSIKIINPGSGQPPIVQPKARINWNPAPPRTSWANGSTWVIPLYTKVTFIVTDGNEHNVTITPSGYISPNPLVLVAGSTPANPVTGDITFGYPATYTLQDTLFQTTIITVKVVDGCCENKCGVPRGIKDLTTGFC